ncbi:MAG: cellulase family glycosylhydrolase [Eudoraea sp.]|nr:cellulase family glycosylhydrolase [Eudoraea sp.]MBT8292863.1 cellulase family glycosylhydrolase [Eudoraea sp.]NNL03606.1 cellulase family glycosylhydrolase [Eudoraea sp.]
MKYLGVCMLFFIVLACGERNLKKTDRQDVVKEGQRWSAKQAWDWYNDRPWYLGANFNPSSSINQLEFWQEDTFDPETIDRELKWSADLGMNLHRVYLHNLLWEQDSIGFLNRLENYLGLAEKYNIKTMFVLLDDVWHPIPKPGVQPQPVPHVHNSGWVQSPGAEILGDSTRHHELESYIKGVVRHFAKDDRVLVWDLYNEPDNVAGQPGRRQLEVDNKHVYSLMLLKKVMKWAREINPSQPLTTGIWRGNIDHWGTPDSLPALDSYMLVNSDIISFHAYDGEIDNVKKKITELQKYNRPLFCTEYLARGVGNTFESVLPILKENKIAAINWGFVSGKTNTIYPWKSWDSAFTEEPEIWHHDILRPNGSPFSVEETDFIKQLSSNSK